MRCPTHSTLAAGLHETGHSWHYTHPCTHVAHAQVAHARPLITGSAHHIHKCTVLHGQGSTMLCSIPHGRLTGLALPFHRQPLPATYQCQQIHDLFPAHCVALGWFDQPPSWQCHAGGGGWLTGAGTQGALCRLALQSMPASCCADLESLNMFEPPGLCCTSLRILLDAMLKLVLKVVPFKDVVQTLAFDTAECSASTGPFLRALELSVKAVISKTCEGGKQPPLYWAYIHVLGVHTSAAASLCACAPPHRHVFMLAIVYACYNLHTHTRTRMPPRCRPAAAAAPCAPSPHPAPCPPCPLEQLAASKGPLPKLRATALQAWGAARTCPWRPPQSVRAARTCLCSAWLVAHTCTCSTHHRRCL
eukprot:scaffold246749_cov23-Tisochrysis_lutea.AAC.1